MGARYVFRNLLRITGLLLPFVFVVNTTYAADSVCAVVKIEIQQELTLERQAFDAVMKINNGLDTLPIENVSVNVTFADEAGNPVLATTDTTNTDAKFFIRLDTMSGISDVSGTGSVQPSSTAEIHWLIIPAPGSSSGVPSGTLYYVGATLSYTLGGEPQETTVTPDFIYVKPLPLLNLDYFLTKDIVADDPFTAEIEPPEPFVLGVRVKNAGAATATNVAIDSAQPTIVENKQGLPIQFVITGSAVNEQPSSPSLLINLGDVAPNASTMGRWDMQTNIAGQFTEFTAEFSHADELGGQLTSIINSVNTHFLEHNVLVDLPGRDTIRDFLARDNDVYRVYESDSIDTVVTDQSANASFTQIGSNSSELVYKLSAPQTAGLMYVRVPDSYQGSKAIKSVTRADGKRLVEHNAWHSQKRDRNNNVWLHYFNFFDSNSNGQYTVVLEDAPVRPQPPVLQLVPDRSVVEGNPIGFIVEASDPNGDIPTITAGNLPTGATFVDNGDGTAAFNWQTQVGQDGSYAITYTATDNSGLTTSQTANIKVNPTWDTDGDGMADDWEVQYFGDLSRDGTGDYDNDGYTDLQEYQNGTDPTAVPPAIPDGLTGEAGNNEITLSWNNVTDATSYNLYWSTAPGVNKDNGTPISGATSPYLHSGLTNKTTYYYVVTSVGPGGESDISTEFSLIAGVRDWEDPQLLDSLATDNLGASKPHVAARADGQAIAVWQQANGSLTEIRASRYVPDVGWSAAEKISTNISGDTTNARVTMDSSGNAMAVWQQADGSRTDIYAVHYTADAGWGSPTLIETDDSANATQPVIAMLGDGRSMVLWIHGGNTVRANWYIPALGWGTAERIETNNVQAVADLHVSIDAFGNGLALWSSSADGQLFDILYNRYLAGNGWQGAQAMRSGITGGTNDPVVHVAMAGDAIGNAMAVWNEFDSTRNNIQSSRFSSSNSNWSTPVAIETNDGDARLPQLSVDGAGNAMAVWQQHDGTRTNIWSNRYVSNGGWGTAELIETNDSSDAVLADVVLTGQGHAVATWLQSNGVHQNLWANVYKPLNGWQTAQIIEANGLGDVSHVELAGDNSSGDIFTVWQQFDGQLSHVAFNRYAIGNNGISNLPPIAVTNGDQTVNEQTTVTLDASGSQDQDGTVVSYQWTQTGGTSVELANAGTATATFTAPTLIDPAQLTFKVIVIDDFGASSEQQVTIIVNPVNTAPLVSAGDDLSVDEVTTVNLNGNASDSDGSIVVYQWSQLSGTAVTLNNAGTAIASFTAPRLKLAETLSFRLTVTDNEGAVAFDDVIVTVNPVNTPPIADAGTAQTVDEYLTVNLDGSVSTDPDVDGSIVKWQWQQLSGPTVTLSGADTASPGFVAPAVYQDTDFAFRLTITDDEGGVASATTTVTVVSVNPDDDADGMLDLWEIRYFDTLDRDGTQDYDGDGATDKAEHDYGTDPTVAYQPSQPEIVSPDLVEVTTLQPELVLRNPDQHPGFPVSYQFEVYRDAAMTELVTSAIGAGASWTVDLPLADNTWYYWRARANGLVLFSEWVSSRFFVNTVNDAPGPFHVSYPQDGVWVDSFTPTLSVTNSVDVDEDALSYRFEVYAGNDTTQSPVAAGDNIPPGNNGTTSWTVDTYLQENHWYTWRAVVTDEHGLSTGTADAMMFVNTVNDAPSVPTIVNPVDGSEITILNPNLVINNSVEPEAEPVQYLFELDTVNTFDSVNKQVSGAVDEGLNTTSWSLADLQDNTWYYWRVKATDGRAESDWANARFFVNRFNDAPGAPRPLNPGELAWIGTLQPTLEVYPAVDVDEDALRYEYEVYSANRKGEMQERVANGISDQTYWQVPTAFEDSGYYYWRARAIDEHGLAGSWSDWVMFYADADGVNDPPRIKLRKLKYKHGDVQAIHKLEKGKHDDGTGIIEIRWKDRDPDSNARINLYYDTDREGQDGVLIAGNILEDPDGKADRYEWDISRLPAGIYFVYAVIDDGTNSEVEYSSNAVIVGDGAGRPFIIIEKPEVENEGKRNQRAKIEWRDLDSDSNARISLFYDTDNSGYDGSLIAGDLEEDPDGKDDKYLWDVSAIKPGEYYIYAVISDGTAQYRVYAGEPVNIKGTESHDDDKEHGNKGKNK